MFISFKFRTVFDLFIYLFKHNFFYYYLSSRKNSDLELTTIEFIKKVYLKIN